MHSGHRGLNTGFTTVQHNGPGQFLSLQPDQILFKLRFSDYACAGDECYKYGKRKQCLSFLQFQFKEIVLTEEEKRLLAKEGATIPTHMPLTKVKDSVQVFIYSIMYRLFLENFILFYFLQLMCSNPQQCLLVIAWPYGTFYCLIPRFDN